MAEKKGQKWHKCQAQFKKAEQKQRAATNVTGSSSGGSSECNWQRKH